MPNRLTRVPTAPVPPPRGLAAAMLPLADMFMIAMVSRPATGSLRTTWVTPATLWMAAAACAGSALLAAVLLAGIAGRGVAGLIGAVVCIAFALGSGAVGVIGLDQRRGRGLA